MQRGWNRAAQASASGERTHRDWVLNAALTANGGSALADHDYGHRRDVGSAAMTFGVTDYARVEAVPDRRSLIAAAVRAAALWERRASWDDSDSSLRDLARMIGIVSLARACYLDEDSPPLATVLDAFSAPLSDLLPAALTQEGDEAVILLRGGRLTEEAKDLFAETAPVGRAVDPASIDWDWLTAEQTEEALFRDLVFGGQAIYVAGRRALTEHPAGSEQSFADLWNRVGWRPPSGTIRQIPADRRHGRWCALCPLCRWPMAVSIPGDQAILFECSFEPHRRQGARFLFDGIDRASAPRLRPLGGLGPPDCGRADGLRMLAWPIWRYVTVPGLSELALAARVAAVGGVELWPDLDRVDIRVRAKGLEWEADVKDWTSGPALTAYLARHADAAAHSWLVVPWYRTAQLQILRERLAGRQVGTIEDFVRHIRRQLPQASR